MKPLANRFQVVLAVLLFALCTTLTAAAQTSGKGTISGTLTDSTGAIVPNAPVVVTNTDTGVSRTISSNSTGEYTAPFLEPGHYEVIAGGGSYSKADHKNLVLTVGETLTVDATLTAGGVTTEGRCQRRNSDSRPRQDRSLADLRSRSA